MDLQTATPARIDATIDEIQGRAAAVTVDLNRRENWLATAEQDIVKHTEAGSDYYAGRARERAAKLQTEIVNLTAQLDALHAEAAPLHAEFTRRGGWSRYYLVDNTSGHVHPNTDWRSCSRTRTTLYAWLTEQSGMSAEDLVELAGETACTTCFPWAPVSVLNRPTRLEAPARKAAREAREQAAAAKAAKKAKNAITNPDGSQLTVKVSWSDRREAITNRVTAMTWAVDQIVDEHIYDRFTRNAADFADVVAALAHKAGTTTDAIEAEITKKAAAKIRKFDREAAAAA